MLPAAWQAQCCTPFVNVDARLLVRLLTHCLISTHAPRCQELSLAGNCLSELPQGIGRLKALKRLGLAGNRLTRLPHSIGELTQLEVNGPPPHTCICVTMFSCFLPAAVWLAGVGGC